MNEQKCQDERKETQFEGLLNELELAVILSQTNSGSYRALIGRISDVNLKSDEVPSKDLSNSPVVEPNTVIYKLGSLISRLQDANRRNVEIIDHLKTLV
jgi:hypothetical protein